MITTKQEEKKISEKIIIVDIETTGFIRSGLICEIGIVELDLSNGNIKPVYNELVKEDIFSEYHKSSWIFNNSDLKWDDINNLGKPLDVEKLQNIFNSYRATAYNKKFDFDFLRSRGLTIKELDCPMLLSTNVVKLPSKGYGSYKWPKVQEAYDYFFPNNKYIEKHRGFDDAKHEAQIVFELYKRGIFKI